MKTAPIRPARIEYGADGVPTASDFGDIYHPRIGAVAQARHVFLGGNGLPAGWAGRERFVVLETGFGLGNNFLATWDAWRSDPARCRQLVFVSIEAHPPALPDLLRAQRDAPWPALAAALCAAWPPATANLHPIDFEQGRVRLLLAFGDVAAVLRELTLRADAFYLDGFAPARNPAMWTPMLMKALARRAAPGARAATWSVARELRDGLQAAGFEVATAPGIGGKREITVARFQPRFQQRLRPGLQAAPPSARRDAVVVGAGLAGAAVAHALAAEGWQVSVLDRQPRPAAETSGNVAGLFHGTVHGDDGAHARLLRSAAQAAERALRPGIEAGTVAGQVQGLLRLDARSPSAMQALIDHLGLPPAWVRALDAAQASALAGVPLPSAAWHFGGGGWVSPVDVVQGWLHGLRFVGGCDVQALQAVGDSWRLLDGQGRMLAEAGTVVLASAGSVPRLLAPLGLSWPLRALRGQVSGWTGAATPLQRPVAGDGYAIPLPDGLLCGATSQADDVDASARDSDAQLNLERLLRLTGLRPPAGSARMGRVGWRCSAEDRLPVAGAVPLRQPDGRADQARLWPRHPGLWVCTGLGGRGITLAPLLGRLLAAQIAAAPWPLEQDLADAIDPARWGVRAARRAGAG